METKLKLLHEELKSENELLFGFIKNCRTILRNHNFFILTKRIYKICERMKQDDLSHHLYYKLKNFIIQIGRVFFI